MSARLGQWTSVPSESGTALALGGGRLAVTGPSRAVVWDRDRRICLVDAPWPSPGAPRLAAGALLWGPSAVDLANGAVRVVQAAVPQVMPGSMDRASTYAWSADGTRLLAVLGTPARALLLDGQGALQATLWTGSSPPRAAWLGRRAAVLGLPDPSAYSPQGELLATVRLGAGTISHLESTADESQLLAVELNQRLTLIDAAGWTVCDRWSGEWVHGAIAPSGRFAAGLTFDGRLQLARLEGGRFAPAAEAGHIPGALAVALADGEVAVVAGGKVQRATLSWEDRS